MHRHARMLHIVTIAFLLTNEARSDEPTETTTANSNAPQECATEEAALNAITTKYQDEYAKLSEDPEKPAPFKFDAVVTYKNQDFSFDVPEVTMKQRTFALHTLQATMRTRRMSLKRPVVTMENRTVGHNVEVKCTEVSWRHPVPKCTAYRTPIITKIPTTRMELKELKWDVPDFAMKRTEMKFKVPEFMMKRRDMVVKLPQFTFRELTVGLTPEQQASLQQEAAEKRSKEAQAVTGHHKAESGAALKALLTCHRASLLQQRKNVSKEFEGGITQLRAAIAALTSAGGDPTHVPSENGETNLVLQLEDLIAKRDESLKGLDDALAAIEATQDTSFRRFTEEPAAAQATEQ